MKLVCYAMIFMLVSSTISYAISGDPIATVKQNIADFSGFQNLQTQAFHLRTIGPFQSVNIKFQQTGNNDKIISATYHSWFGMKPQMKCFSGSSNTICR